MKEIPKYKNINFKIRKIIPLENGAFKTEFETKFGIHKITFPEDEKFIHIKTGKPKFLHKIKEYVEKKFSQIEIQKSDEYINELQDLIGLNFQSKDIEDRSVEYLSYKIKKTREERKEEIKKQIEEDTKHFDEIRKKIAKKRAIKEQALIEQKKLNKLGGKDETKIE